MVCKIFWCHLFPVKPTQKLVKIRHLPPYELSVFKTAALKADSSNLKGALTR